MEDIHCQGCGAPTQTKNQDEIGYTPESALSKEVILCQRCFKLKHYNEIQDVSVTDDDFLKMVSEIRDVDGLAVHLIDIFDVNGSMIKSLARIIGDKPIILVGNKVDLLPKSTNKQKLINWLKKSAKEAGIKVQDVHLISSIRGHGIEKLTEAIEVMRKNRNVYVVGTTNVGKSTFINRLIQQTTGDKNVITTSYFPGTTLGFIEIPLDDSSVLIDTPGIVNKEQMAHYVSKSDLKVITPAKEIKPRVFQLNSQQTLFFGGLGRIDFIKGDKQSFVCYFSNQLDIHRTKFENADKLYDDHVGEFLSPPDESTRTTLPKLVQSTFKIREEKMDIVFPGLGWVMIPEANTTVIVHSPRTVAVSIRKALI
ncbi:ribosome biogenesis GTPase YqeH [Virgibacillus sp. DJP39]|uniref:ribosome biogenesis GTPase YqeH n=1 Tax=Virgibacillus sp. DJP39 TaxID=3409790 RepID=UPI003BB5AA30